MRPAFDNAEHPRDAAQELMWDAMDRIADDPDGAEALCRRALDAYPDCVDALAMLANLTCDRVVDYVNALHTAVEAGRRDLGQDFFEQEAGHFWGLIETRPFMRAVGQLTSALIDWGTAPRIDEAITLQEEMLRLNPNDNQGVRDPLAGCYLSRKRYAEADRLLKQYEEDTMSAPLWARVLLAHATGDLAQAQSRLAAAREQNPYTELYLTGKKRRPRTRPSAYCPGDPSEAVFCADALWEAWKKHPASKRWLKEACG